MKRILKIGAAVALALLAIAAIDQRLRPEYYAGKAKQREQEEQREREQKVREIDARLKREGEAAARVPRVTAGELLDAYAANEISADSRFKGQKIHVTGIISSIGKDILGSPYLTLTADGKPAIRSVQAVYPKSEEGSLAFRSKGEKYTVTCICSGLLMNVLLKCGT